MELKPEFKEKKENWMERQKRKFREEYGDPVKTVYRLQEYDPSWEDEYDRTQPERHISYSDWIDTKEAAEELLSKMRPSHRDYKIRIVSKTLYRVWVPPKEGYYKETWF